MGMHFIMPIIKILRIRITIDWIIHFRRFQLIQWLAVPPAGALPR